MRKIFTALVALMAAFSINEAEFRDVKDITGNVVKIPAKVEKSLRFGMRTIKSY